MVYVVIGRSTMLLAKDPTMTIQRQRREGVESKTHCLLFISSGEGMRRYRYRYSVVEKSKVNDRVQVGRKSVIDVFGIESEK